MNHRPSFFTFAFASSACACVAIFAALAVGCGGTTSEPAAVAAADGGAPPAPTASASGSGTVAPPGPDAAPPPPALDPCPDIVDDGPDALLHMVAADPPTAVGGTIANGKYHLVDVSVFMGPSGPSGPLEAKVTSTVRIAGNVADAVLHGPEGESRMRFRLDVSANEVTYEDTCGTAKKKTGHYSGGAALTLFLPNDEGRMVAFRFEPAKK